MRIFSLVVSLTIFFLLTTWNFNALGYYYDELLNAVSTQKMLIGNEYRAQARELTTIQAFGRAWPVMSLHYFGHLKSYLLFIPFLLFGDTLLVLRAFSIVCGVITVILVFYFTNRNFNHKIAFITTILFACDPSFITMSIYDFAPTAVQNILKITILILFFELWSPKSNIKPKAAIAALLGTSSGLIIWDKLVGIWIVLPVFILLSVRYKLYTVSAIKKYKLAIISALVSLLVTLSPVIYFLTMFNFSEKSTEVTQKTTEGQTIMSLVIVIAGYLFQKLQKFWETLNGVGSFNQFIIEKPISSGIFGYIFIASLVVFIFWLLKKRIVKSDLIFWVAIIFFIVTVFILVTPFAVWGHHMFFVWPLPYLIVAFVLSHINKKVTIIITLIIITSSVLVLFRFNLAVNSGNISHHWNEQDKLQLTSYLKNNNSKQSVLAVDWGISLPIAFISKGEIPISSFEGAFKQGCPLFEQYVKPEDQVFVLYTANKEKILDEYTGCKNSLTNNEYQTDIVGPFTVIYTPN
jgi:hypothetical protein